MGWQITIRTLKRRGNDTHTHSSRVCVASELRARASRTPREVMELKRITLLKCVCIVCCALCAMRACYARARVVCE